MNEKKENEKQELVPSTVTDDVNHDDLILSQELFWYQRSYSLHMRLQPSLSITLTLLSLSQHARLLNSRKPVSFERLPFQRRHGDIYFIVYLCLCLYCYSHTLFLFFLLGGGRCPLPHVTREANYFKNQEMPNG